MTAADSNKAGPPGFVVDRSETMHIGTSWTESLVGALQILGALATPFLGPRRRRWGATDREIEAAYPGDELIPEPRWAANHAISIDAMPEQVWPWIAQIGQGRGGFYTYEKLENIAGCQMENSSRILDEHQSIRPGDPIRLAAEMPPMRATVVDQPTALVLFGTPGAAEDGTDGPSLSSSWALLLLEQPDGTTRLLSRTRYDCADDLRSRLLGGPLLLEPISSVMERKMLRVIKALAEAPRR
jgi:hypothetical protein